MLSCLVWEIWTTLFKTIYLYMYQLKSHRVRKHRRALLRGLNFSGWGYKAQPQLLFKYSNVILSSLDDPGPSFWTKTSLWIESHRARKHWNPGACNFQGGVLVLRCNYHCCWDIPMLSCLVWEIRTPLLRLYVPIFQLKSHRVRKYPKPLHRSL